MSDNEYDEKTNIIEDFTEDTIDILECDIEEYENETNFAEKISKHSNLNKKVSELINTVNGFIETIDEIDNIGIEELSDIEESDLSTTLNNIEKEIEELEDQEIIKTKIDMYQIILTKIKKAKAKCEESSLNSIRIN
jgi:hypothetical protein